MKCNPIVIAGMPRSGSTLLMRLCNSLEGVSIAGENWNAFDHLRLFWESTKQDQNYIHAPWDHIIANERFPAFYAKFDEKRVDEDLRKLIKGYLCPNGDCEVFGFKEIRLASQKYIDFVRFAVFFKRMFPSVGFMTIRRNLGEVKRSADSLGWHDSGDLIQRLQQQQDNFDRLGRDSRFLSTHLEYEKMIQSYEYTRRKFERIGHELQRKNYEKVIAVKLR